MWEAHANLIPTRHLSDEARVAVRCLLTLAFVITFGTLGFWLIEKDWTVWRSLFFTLITITTVGYGDEGLSSNGEKFAAILLLIGIGTATYSLSAFVQFVMTYQSAWKRKMQRAVSELRQHFIVCGFGRMGETISEELHSAGIPFVIVDECEDRLARAIREGYLCVTGNAADENTLVEANLETARGVVCAVGSDADNVFITLTARDLAHGVFIACRSTTESAARRMSRAGADLIVSPYRTAGHNIADAILRPRLSNHFRSYCGERQILEMSELEIAPGSPLAEQKIADIGTQFTDLVFLALSRRGQEPIIRPGGNHVLQVGDVLTTAGRPDDLESFLAEFQPVAGELPTTPANEPTVCGAAR